jgi:uncharacterized radical SAM superfamily Fe-S cluster-containing enzyme
MTRIGVVVDSTLIVSVFKSELAFRASANVETILAVHDLTNRCNIVNDVVLTRKAETNGRKYSSL